LDGELAQAIALTAYGNTFLYGLTDGVAPDLSKYNSTFQYVGRLQFLYNGSDRKEVEVSDSTSRWYEHLQSHGAKRLGLQVFPSDTGLPEYVATTFAGTGKRAIQVSFERGYDIWVQKWSREGAGSKRWAVRYRGGPLEKPVVGEMNLEAAARILSSEIRKARDLTSKATLMPRAPGKYFAQFLQDFDEALRQSESPDPVIPYHPDMLPFTYSLKARQVAASAARAWVFGGMGAWSDLLYNFPGIETEFREVANSFYNSVVTALVAAANSFAPD
jgi:hypothetical protein